MIKRRRVWWQILFFSVLAGCVLCLGVLAPAIGAARADSGALQQAFARAAREFGVPESVLLAVSYNVSRWEQHNGRPSTTGAYGVMGLVDLGSAVPDGGKGDSTPRLPAIPAQDPSFHTLQTAAGLLGAGPDTLKADAAQNIRGGAALLAQYARDTVGTAPKNLADWYGAVAKYSGSPDKAAALGFADDVYATITQGAARTTTDGQQVALPAQPVRPNAHTADALRLRDPPRTDAECPPDLSCEFIPAAYQQNNPNDPTDYGNYDLAVRPTDGLRIQYIVIHDTESSYNSTINEFQNSLSYVSAHYVIRSSDGHIAQMVPNTDVAWHAGNWYVNAHAIGIEHEGYAVEGATWYTEQLYHASARLVRFLANRYHVPVDREHIVGHDNVPGPLPANQTSMHWDPGPFWDWTHYMSLMGPVISPAHGTANVVMITPDWATNQPPLTYCDPTCHALPTQSANFVYLRTGPSDTAPLLDDPALPGAGTTNADDWGDKAVSGQLFYQFATQGDWHGIYYGGQQARFNSPPAHPATTASWGTLVTPLAGRTAIPVYGRAYPEAAAYPPGVPVQSITPLQYTIPAGQVYVARDRVLSDYYYAPTYTQNPADHVHVVGQTQYYVISFNHRLAYLQASDVDVLPSP
jgi:N-acetyl-anhydromuramyl-L-alanine amidase AmpD